MSACMVSSDRLITSMVRRSPGRASKGPDVTRPVAGAVRAKRAARRPRRDRSTTSSASRAKSSGATGPAGLPTPCAFAGPVARPDERVTEADRGPGPGVPDSETATVTSDCAAVVGSTGSGFTRAPSASRRPCSITGVITLGMAMDARIATSTGPSWNQTSRRLPMSAATAV